jgi:hypothetical protein
LPARLRPRRRLSPRGDEDLAVADAPGLRGVLDRLDHALGERIVDHDLQLHLGQEVDDIFGAAIQFGVALLPAEAARLRHGDAGHADIVQRFLDLIQLERLDDRLDLLHANDSPSRCLSLSISVPAKPAQGAP